MSRDIPSEEILAVMNNIDNHINKCLMAVHGIRYILKIQDIVANDITSQEVLNHYYTTISGLAGQISEEVQNL